MQDEFDETEKAEMLSLLLASNESMAHTFHILEQVEKAANEKEAANEAKNNFLAGMSHELRTPLNAIIGFSEVLRDRYFGDLNAKQAAYITDIMESGNHLLSNAAKFTPDNGEIRLEANLISDLGFQISDLEGEEKQSAIRNPKSKSAYPIPASALQPRNGRRSLKNFIRLKAGFRIRLPARDWAFP